jgi:hypothetical protein
MNWIVSAISVAGVVIIVVLLLQRLVEGFINTQDAGPATIDSMRTFFDSSDQFQHFCLTKQPRGALNSGYQWNKYWHIPAHNHLYRNCDQYSCKTVRLNGTTAQPQVGGGKTLAPSDVSDVNWGWAPDYYQDPITFCVNNPEHLLCPNHWISSF